jgi:hypothetical protein
MELMITTTLNRIRAHGPCGLRPPRDGEEPEGWVKLLRYLGHPDRYPGDDEPLAYATIVHSNGLNDALWCCRAEPQHTDIWCEFALWCAEQVRHLTTDQRALAALDVTRRYIDSEATENELDDARAAAWVADWAANAAAWAADWAANAAWDAADTGAADWAANAAWAATEEAQQRKFLEMVGEADDGHLLWEMP